MNRYSRKASEKVEQAVHEMKEGKLRTGTGKKVTNRKQAVAIGLSQARRAGARVPRRSDTDSADSGRSGGKSASKSAGKSRDKA